MKYNFFSYPLDTLTIIITILHASQGPNFVEFGTVSIRNFTNKLGTAFMLSYSGKSNRSILHVFQILNDKIRYFFDTIYFPCRNWYLVSC